jgi:hypothetical protein
VKVKVGQPKLRDPYALAKARREALTGGVRAKGKGYGKRDRRAWRRDV